MKVLILALTCFFSNEILICLASEEMCDVKSWYIERLSSGAFGSNLNDKQAEIKSTVEELIRSKKGSVEVECDVLQNYDNVINGVEEQDSKKDSDNEPTEAEQNVLHDSSSTVTDDKVRTLDPTDVNPTELDEQDIEDNSDEIEANFANNEGKDDNSEVTEEIDQEIKKVEHFDEAKDNEEIMSAKNKKEENIREVNDPKQPTEHLEENEAEETHEKETQNNITETAKIEKYATEDQESLFVTGAENFLTEKLMPSAMCLKGNVCAITESLFLHLPLLDNLIEQNMPNFGAGNRSRTNITQPMGSIAEPIHKEISAKDGSNIWENKDESLKKTESADERKIVRSNAGASGENGKENDLKDVMQNNLNEEVPLTTSYNMKDIEELLAQRKIEYAHKIKDIEFQLLRLENRLLTETLHKQNNSAGYTRLENLILKLENELLKINRSFSVIQEENNQLKAKQLSEKQIYEIFNKAREENKAVAQKYLALAGNSTALEFMVDKQQNKIVELVIMMHNQTDFINKLEEKSKRLEDQNRELHKVLVNQADMMAELVKGMNFMKAEQEKLKSTVVQPQPLTTTDSHVDKEDQKKSEDKSANTDPPEVGNAKSDDKISNFEDTKVSDGENDQVKSEDEAKLKPQEILRPEDVAKEEEAGKTKNATIHSDTPEIPEVKKDPPKIPKEAQEPLDSAVKSTKATSKKTTKQVKIPDTPKYHQQGSTGPKDCYDHMTSGKRKRDMAMRIKVGPEGKEAQVFCDMKNGGWTVIMRRSEGSVNFFRDWDSYKNGFGGVLGEHWIGNDVIHYMTNQKNYRLRVEMTDWKRNTAWAEYDYFMIDDESNSYMLHVTGFNSDSPAGDGLLKHNGMKFSTKDVDNDMAVKDFDGSCAKRFSGAWWYYKCYKSNLTGKYYRDGTIAAGMYDGVSWKAWRPASESLKKVEMKIIPRNTQ